MGHRGQLVNSLDQTEKIKQLQRQSGTVFSASPFTEGLSVEGCPGNTIFIWDLDSKILTGHFQIEIFYYL